jgi:hypothetical protein
MDAELCVMVEAGLLATQKSTLIWIKKDLVHADTVEFVSSRLLTTIRQKADNRCNIHLIFFILADFSQRENKNTIELVIYYTSFRHGYALANSKYGMGRPGWLCKTVHYTTHFALELLEK